MRRVGDGNRYTVPGIPIGLNGGMNTYSYVFGNPLIGIDPLGLVDPRWFTNQQGGGTSVSCSQGTTTSNTCFVETGDQPDRYYDPTGMSRAFSPNYNSFGSANICALKCSATKYVAGAAGDTLAEMTLGRFSGDAGKYVIKRAALALFVKDISECIDLCVSFPNKQTTLKWIFGKISRGEVI